MLTHIASTYSLDQPSIQLPFITNRWAVGFFFLVHIIFGSFTMGALVLGPTFEWIGLRREDPRYERYARALGNVNLKIFSLGATLGGFAHRFVGNLSWASFFIAAVAAVYAATSRQPANRVYFHWAARTSLVVGFATLVVQIVLGAVFVESIKQASPGAFHYSMQGPFAWLWLLQATFIAILLVGSNLYFWQSRPTPAAPVLTGIVVLGSLITMTPAAVFPKDLFALRYVALAIAVLVSIVHWLISRPRRHAMAQDLRRSSQVTLAVTGASALLLFLLMGVIRTTARSDYTIYGVMKESDSYSIFQSPSKGYYP